MDVTIDFQEVTTELPVEVGNGVESDQPAPTADNETESGSSSQGNGEGLEPGDKFYGTIKTNVNGENKKITDIFTVESNDGSMMEVRNNKGDKFKTNPKTVERKDIKKELERKAAEVKEKERLRKEAEEQERKKKQREEEENRKKEEFEKKATSYDTLSPDIKLKTLVDIGMQNIWMVGPAGSGKSTMARNIANDMELPYLCISCGIGTSAAEFVGYKFPTREATKFSEYYAKPSIILVDEITALDPSVAQVLNAALANGEIETTTGLVHRHPECIIIATSNTFGNGASRQYVANNQLDASTIDRFVGATIEIDYSEAFESQYDSEVVEYVKDLRRCIKQYEIRRVASTRMIQSAQKVKSHFIRDWKELMIKPWTDSEKMLVKKYFEDKKTVTSLVKIGSTIIGESWSN